MVAILVIWVLSVSEPPEPAARNVIGALARLGLSSAIVVASQAIDEHPVWSPDGQSIAVNTDQKWSKLDLGSVTLIRGTWHGGKGIGVADPPSTLTPIPASEVQAWEKLAKYGPRTVTTKAGTVVELEQVGLSTAFRITSKGGRPREVWNTSTENCHGLALSPDESLVAFVCELNGVIVSRLYP